ncbi:Clavaminate synthase-like protein [Aureobasidium subglaciale]|nr:Clavaminate synthase-like protein [Aureobasidium subglaciale]
MAMILTGAPLRRELILSIFDSLQHFLDPNEHKDISKSFPVTPSTQPQNDTITRAEKLDFLQFQKHLVTKTTPMIIKGAIDDWPAIADQNRRWSDPSYLLKATLGGRRLVPVELGRTYTDDGWSQRIMTFSEYMKSHLLQSKQEKTGYLAQHDLFAQIPNLSDDTSIPDYCYTEPPVSELLTSGIAEILDEPLRNAWLGPAGTIKTTYLYPRGIDDTGVNMDNTSHIDISLAKRLYTSDSESKVDDEAKQQFEAQYPSFNKAQCVEGVLGPGECLYIPTGWWHYIESLSTSFSMSFWWN